MTMHRQVMKDAGLTDEQIDALEVQADELTKLSELPPGPERLRKYLAIMSPGAPDDALEAAAQIVEAIAADDDTIQERAEREPEDTDVPEGITLGVLGIDALLGDQP